MVAVGATLNISYDIVAEVAGTFTGSSDTLCSSGPGGNTLAAGTNVVVGGGDTPRYTGCRTFQAIARSGDPAGFSPFNPGSFGFTAADVPTPASLPLVGLGLALAAAVTRRGRPSAA